MRMRILPLAGLALLAAVPAPVRAADDKPALVVVVKSLDGLISDAKYVAELAGKEEDAKQAEAMLKSLLGSPQGLEGVDPKKPIGLYARIDPDNPQASEVVALAPISDEDAFLKLLKRQDKIKVEDKAADGTYQINATDLPVPLFMRFSGKYVYVTGPTKAALAADRLIPPEKVLAAKTTSLVSVVLHVGAIPQNYKDMALTAVAQQLAKSKTENPPNEPPDQKAFRMAAIDEAGDLVKSIIQDGAEVTVSMDVDQKAGELSASASFSAKSGSPLAKDIADLGAKKSVGASLVGADSAAHLVFDVSLPEKLRQALSEAVDESVKKALADPANQGQKETVEAFFKAVLPTIKAGELDGGFDLRGPSASGLYTVLVGLKAQNGGDLEKLFRDALKTAPEKDRDQVKLDVDKAGGVGIHRIIPKDKSDDPNVKKLFGDNPQVYFAFRPDAVLIAGGADGLAALKQTLTAKPAAGAMVQMQAAISRAAPLMTEQNPTAPDVAKQVFASNKNDKVRLSVEGGKALTVKFSMDAPVVTFSAKIAEAQQKPGQDK